MSLHPTPGRKSLSPPRRPFARALQLSAVALSLFTAPFLAADDEIIMDKLSYATDGIVTQGSWKFSNSVPGSYNSGYYYDGNTNKGGSYVQFTPPITETGDYEVSVRWAFHPNRAPSVPIVVTHAGGTNTHDVDQQKDSGEWHLLDTYTFAAGGAGNVRIHNGGTVGQVVVDAVRFYKPDAPEVIEVFLDSDDPAHASYVARSSGWKSSTSIQQYLGANYYHDQDTRDGNKTVTFTPNLPVTGTYDVYLIWAADQNRASNAKVIFNHANGTDETTINQKDHGGQWQYVDTYAFNAGMGGSVTLSNAGANGFVIADSILFDLRPDAYNEVTYQRFDSPTLPSTGGWGFGSATDGQGKSGAVSIVTNTSQTLNGSTGSIRGVYPARGTGGASYVWGGYGVSELQTRELYIEFWAKMPGAKQGLKFLKIFGEKVGNNYANTTFGLDYTTGSMTAVSFGDGHEDTIANDTANVINFNGTNKDWIGRSYGEASVSTPQNQAWSAGNWGASWHHFRIRVKFNSGTSAATEVADGAYYVEIDGVVYVNATGLFNRHWSNGPIESVSLFGWTQSGTSAFEIWYDDVRITTDGFATP